VNLPAYFQGCLKALGPAQDWPNYFNLDRAGLKQSFIALALTLPCFYLCGIAAQTEISKITDRADITIIPPLAFIILSTLYALTFAFSAYILTMFFDKQDRFRPWVIVRHWTIFFAVLIVAAFYGLYLLSIIPYALATFVAFVFYLGTLAIDARLAQKIVGFPWGTAILIACIITATGLSVFLIGLMLVLGQ